MLLTLTDEDLDRLDVTNPELKDRSPFNYCPTCKKTGTYLWRGEIRECNCLLQLNLLKKYLSCGVGKPYQTLDWDDWDQDPGVRMAAEEYMNDLDNIEDGQGLFLWGKNGTGKTMLGILVLKGLIKRGYRCYATTAPDTITAFTAGWKSDEDKRWFERDFTRSQILLLDDLGKEYDTKLSQNILDNLLRARVQAGRPTIITTNLTLAGVIARYGYGTMDLIIERSLQCEFSGESYRSKLSERRTREKELGERRPIV